jgi:hypothetical protein
MSRKVPWMAAFAAMTVERVERLSDAIKNGEAGTRQSTRLRTWITTRSALEKMECEEVP